jgi:hypothetical protein
MGQQEAAPTVTVTVSKHYTLNINFEAIDANH